MSLFRNFIFSSIALSIFLTSFCCLVSLGDVKIPNHPSHCGGPEMAMCTSASDHTKISQGIFIATPESFFPLLLLIMAVFIFFFSRHKNSPTLFKSVYRGTYQYFNKEPLFSDSLKYALSQGILNPKLF
jgi:hypothetical protein